MQQIPAPATSPAAAGPPGMAAAHSAGRVGLLDAVRGFLPPLACSSLPPQAVLGPMLAGRERSKRGCGQLQGLHS